MTSLFAGLLATLFLLATYDVADARGSSGFRSFKSRSYAAPRVRAPRISTPRAPRVRTSTARLRTHTATPRASTRSSAARDLGAPAGRRLVKGYTRKDGTVVAPYYVTKRIKVQGAPVAPGTPAPAVKPQTSAPVNLAPPGR